MKFKIDIKMESIFNEGNAYLGIMFGGMSLVLYIIYRGSEMTQ